LRGFVLYWRVKGEAIFFLCFLGLSLVGAPGLQAATGNPATRACRGY
jgi:hypothetical protein